MKIRGLTLLLALALPLACRSAGTGPGVTDDVPAAVDTVAPPTDVQQMTGNDVVARDSTPRVDTAGCVSMGSENTTAACGDGIDNDCDGFVDCGDFNCSCQGSCPSQRAGCTCSGSETTNATCGDSMDNDCNGFTDCSDFACSRNNPAVTICPQSDAGARDATTTSDRPTIPFRDAGARQDARGCDAAGATENTAGACNDGVDNDCDGFVDCADRNCSCVGSCEPALIGCTCRGLEDNNGACGDGVDNDCNSFTDCGDFSCSRNTAVNVCATDAGPAADR